MALPITANIRQFTQISGLGKTSIYELINSGQVESEFVSGRRLIKVASYMELIRASLDSVTPPRLRAEKSRRVKKSRRKMTTRNSFVYFMGGDDGYVKIGFSNNPHKRLRGVQIGSASPVRLLAMLRGDRNDEDSLHKRFAAYRVRGEWFRFEGEFKEYVEGLPHE
jgi:hypothetical protein